MMAKYSFRIVIWATMMLVLSPTVATLSAEKANCRSYCFEKVVDLAKDIESLPDKHHLHTLDGQDVPLATFFALCRAMHPWCCLYEKFYYWKNETSMVTSETSRGPIVHKIRSYHNGISTYCPDMSDPEKTHGDVAEFYDEQGVFMGLAVYMGGGKYCSLPDSNYHP